MKYTIWCVLCLFARSIAAAQPNMLTTDYFIDSSRTETMKISFPAIRHMYEAYAKKKGIPGLAYGIVSGNKLIFTGFVGQQDIVTKIPVTSASVFRIASMTKSFTAMAILKLRDEGKLNLDDPVIRFIPEFKKTQSSSTDVSAITVRNLLTHTAGLPEDNPWADRQLDKSEQDLMDFINKGISIASNPGQRYEYSNLGFAMLGEIITRVSGESFDRYISRNILKPLGMNNTYWEYSRADKNKLVHGYRLVNGKLEEQEMLHEGAFGSTGGLLTSVDDFSKYMMFHLSVWPIEIGKDCGSVSCKTIREMHTQGIITRLRKQSGTGCPVLYSYNHGLTWFKDCSGKLILFHSGGLPGFGSNWAFLPDYDIAVVSFTNLTYAAPDELNVQVLDTLIALSKLSPRTMRTSSILAQRQQQLMAILPDWKNAQQSELFSENFFKDYFIDSLRNESIQLFQKIGQISKIADIIPVNQLRGYFTITGERGKIDIWFTLSPENPARVQEYKMSERLD